MFRRTPALLFLITGLLTAFFVVEPAVRGLAQTYGSRALAIGSNGNDVTDLQMRLYALGYLGQPPDAKFDERTWSALSLFQRDFGLEPSGTAGNWTVSVLDRAYAWQRSVDHVVVAGETLAGVAKQYGTRGSVIRWLNRLQSDTVVPGQRLRVPRGQPPGAAVTPAADPPTAPSPAPPIDKTESPPAPVPQRPPVEQPPPPAPPALPPFLPLDNRPVVLGFYAEDWEGDRRSLNTLRQVDGQVNAVLTFQFQTDDRGNLTGRPFPELMAEAARQAIPVLAVIHNFSGGRFDREVARRMLATPESRAAAAERMAATVIAGGFRGINLDVENVPPNQREGYTDLVRQLGLRLRPAGLAVTLSVPAKVRDSLNDPWSGGFDYGALAPLVDLIVLMTYDQHLPGYPPGPIAGYDWVDRVLKYATKLIPPHKIVAGIAAYAYDWETGGTNSARALSVPLTQRLADQSGARVAWNSTSRTPYFTYMDARGQERVVHFENAESTAAKLALVRQYGLRGIAIWRLGYEDPAIWPVLRAGLEDRPAGTAPGGPGGTAAPRAGAAATAPGPKAAASDLRVRSPGAKGSR